MHVILAGSIPSHPIPITTGTDCASIINRISSTQLVTSFSTYLHQVIREIRLKVRQLKLIVHPVKITAHQDDTLDWAV